MRTVKIKDVVANAKVLFEMHPAPWGFYERGIDGYVVDANGKTIFGGEYCEGYVSKDDPEVAALVNLVNSVAAYMKGE